MSFITMIVAFLLAIILGFVGAVILGSLLAMFEIMLEKMVRRSEK